MVCSIPAPECGEWENRMQSGVQWEQRKASSACVNVGENHEKKKKKSSRRVREKDKPWVRDIYIGFNLCDFAVFEGGERGFV